MEDSAKRRERLQAMRMEAAAAQSPYSSPFSEAATPLPAFSDSVIRLPPPAESTPAIARFDFYTDPLAAFSATKRPRGATAGYSPSSPHTPRSPFRSAGPRNYSLASNHPSVHQFHIPQNPDYGLYQTPSHVPQTQSWRSPVQLPTPFPHYMATPASGPGSWNKRSGASTDFAQNSSRGGFTPQFGRGDSPVGYAGSRGSPHSHPGRGRGWPSSRGSPNSRWSGGRGRGFHGNNSAQRETEGYFMKSMVKDPWRKLKPIVGNILEPLAGPSSWLPKSLTAEKAKFSDSSIRVNSKTSLAEYLAASFDEAAEE